MLPSPPGSAVRSPPTDSPYIDQTYRYGSTMGGNFQQHQGVEFNNPEGTPVHAIGDGVVAFAGAAEAGSNTVAILHDSASWTASALPRLLDLLSQPRPYVEVGQRVAAGDLIAHVGNTGRATNDHLHLEIHASPEDVSLVVDPRGSLSAPHSQPPALDRAAARDRRHCGPGARSRRQPGGRRAVYGVSSRSLAETPFSFAETYEDRAHPDPVFEEHFAIGDVPAGTYVVGTEIDGKKVFRTIRVEEGKLTWAAFKP